MYEDRVSSSPGLIAVAEPRGPPPSSIRRTLYIHRTKIERNLTRCLWPSKRKRKRSRVSSFPLRLTPEDRVFTIRVPEIIRRFREDPARGKGTFFLSQRTFRASERNSGHRKPAYSGPKPENVYPTEKRDSDIFVLIPDEGKSTGSKRYRYTPCMENRHFPIKVAPACVIFSSRGTKTTKL